MLKLKAFNCLRGRFVTHFQFCPYKSTNMRQNKHWLPVQVPSANLDGGRVSGVGVSHSGDAAGRHGCR